MLRKTSAAAAVIAFATAGSALFGGAALADDITNTGAAGGAGGPGQGQCLIPVNASVGALLGIGGDATAVQCSGFGGAGGAGGAGLLAG